MSSILQRLDKYAEQAREPLPGYAAWLEEQDRGFWLGQLRKAALQHYATLPTCPGCGSCETCALSEALAYTADPANGTAGLEAGEIAAALLAAQPRPRVVVVVPAAEKKRR